MGCDIHLFVEVKKDNTWAKVGNAFKAWDYSPESPSYSDEPYNGRSYDLFAILANVRNGFGFAGVKTGEGFNPISNPKGLPKDVTDEVFNNSESWGCDGHSHSFFTVKELLDYDWYQITMKQGIVPYEEYLESNLNIPPLKYCGGICGPSIVTIDENELVKSEVEKLIKEGKKVHIKRRWTITYKDQCGDFIDDTIPELQKLGNPEDVRIVFWFDN